MGSVSALSTAFRAVSAIGENAYIWIAILLFVLATRRRGTARLVIAVLATVLAAQLATDLLKILVARPRPYLVMSDIIRYGRLEPTFSFPSAHASRSFASAAVLSAGLKRWRPLWYAIAISIALSRIVLGVHFPTDVIFGALLGMGLGWALVRLIKVEDVAGEQKRPARDAGK